MKHSAPIAVAFALMSACAAYTSPDEPGGGSSSESPAAGRASAGQPSLPAVGGGGQAASGAAGRASTGGGAGRESSDVGAAGDASGAGGMPAGGMPATGGGSAGTSATAGSGGAVSACGTPALASGATPLIDDFEHLGRAVPANEGRSGVWDVWTKSATASMLPPSANYQTTGADTGAGYTHWTGQSIGGPDDWGPTLTVQLAGGCPYDASAYNGISLRLKGSAVKQTAAASTPVPLKVMLWQPQGVPSKDAKGGTCTAPACYNHYSTFVTVSADWATPITVPFASLTQGQWTGTVPFAWNPKQLVAIQFQVEVDGSKSELTTFDLSLDDLAFVP